MELSCFVFMSFTSCELSFSIGGVLKCIFFVNPRNGTVLFWQGTEMENMVLTHQWSELGLHPSETNL